MELSSRQIIALAAPVIVTYLTWSTVGGRLTTLRKLTSAASSGSASVAKRPEIAPLARNPFAPSFTAPPLDPAAMSTEAEGSGEPLRLRLDGTVVAGSWRMAIINGQRVFEGQAIGALRVKSVHTDSVTLLGPADQPIELTLDIAPAAPAGKPPAGAAPVAQAEKTPLEVGLDALRSGGGADDVLESLGIPRS